MPKDKTLTHNKIIEVAKAEFLAKGFLGASMREIGRQVGMTQAGLYRHYESKEAMFDALVEPFIKKVIETAVAHEKNAYASFDKTKETDVMVSDNVVKMMKGFMEEFPDELKLVVTCSRGTKYESFIHNLIKKETDKTYEAFNYIREHNIPIREISHDEIHVLLSAYFQAIIEPIEHNWPLEKASKCLDLVEEFFIPAWKNLMSGGKNIL